MFTIGQRLKSKVNKIFRGYYEVISVSDTHVIVRAFNNDGTRVSNIDRHCTYKKTIKQAKKIFYTV